MDRTLGSLAATGLILSIIVHGLTFWPGGISFAGKFPFWLLHIGLFVVFVPMLVVMIRDRWRRGMFSWFRIFPWWAIVLIGIAGGYAAANFVLLILRVERGTPEIRDGQFVLMAAGRIVRTLTKDEYVLMLNYVTRGFSGHWMVFYLIPTLYFLFRLPPVQPSGESPPPSGPSRTKE